MAALNYLRMIQTIEDMVRSYKMNEAIHALGQIRQVSQVPPELRAKFAQLCRRAGLNHRALKFLYENVHITGHGDAADRLEYASCLRKVGLINRALAILRHIPNDPTALLHQAFCHVHAWDYARSAQLIEQYLKSNPDERQWLVANVNLAAAHVFCGKISEAHTLLDEIWPQLGAYPHLTLNAMEIRAQAHCESAEWGAARSVLNEAVRRIQNQSGAGAIFIRKWRILERVAGEGIAGQRLEVDEFRKEIRRLGQWETLRSFDWELARLSGRRNFLEMVYFGTPYEELRHRIRESDLAQDLPKFLPRWDGRQKLTEPVTINPYTGDGLPLKFGSLPYRLALILLSDLYQPWTAYRIFDGLFSDQVFDPFSSLKRVYQGLDRMRDLLQAGKVALELGSSGAGYRLRPSGNGVVLIFERMQFQSAEDLIYEALKFSRNDQPFTLAQAEGVLPLSRGKLIRAMRTLRRQGFAETARRGRGGAYRLKPTGSN